MVNITVTYFLTVEGKQRFQDWYTKVSCLSQQQDGFISLSKELDNAGNPTLCLKFQDRDKLNSWACSPQHESLVSEIEKFFIKPSEVEFL
ncbi:MAG: hypothetical protein H0U57_06660 [Tatlockia sp.]|nr:hypothetical protein [Tatlockia sp.]MBA3978359.1 hypothetical protein [Nitrosopumilus sp.]